MGWGLLVCAALAAALAQVGQHWTGRAVAHESLQLESGVPATVYLPSAEARPAGAALPVVVLAHGWASNRGALRELARDVASAGYAAIAIDLSGHGASARPFPAGSRASRALADDVDAAVLYARVEPGFDGQRVALIGHGLGADAVLEYASREPAVSAVIALSPQQGWSGGYTPPNALLLWGEDQPSRVRRQGREIGVRLLGAQQIRLGRGYGEFERGNAVLAREIAGIGYLGLPLSREVHVQVREWLAQSFAQSPPPPEAPAEQPPVGSSGRAPSFWLWCALGLLASAAGFAALGARVPRVGRAPAPGAPGVRGLAQLVGALAAGLLLGGGAHFLDALGPFAFFPFGGARALLGVVAIAGAVLGGFAVSRGDWPRPARSTLAAGLALSAFLYLALGPWLEPLVDPWLGPRRIGWTMLAAGLVLPFFALGEHALRLPGLLGWILPPAAKLLLFAVLIGAARLGWLPGEWLLLAPCLAAVLLGVELAAIRLHQCSGSPWLAGVIQALAFAWFLTATFPLEV